MPPNDDTRPNDDTPPDRDSLAKKIREASSQLPDRSTSSGTAPQAAGEPPSPDSLASEIRSTAQKIGSGDQSEPTLADRVQNAANQFAQGVATIPAETLQGIGLTAKKLNDVIGARQGDDLGDFATYQYGQAIRSWANEAFPDDQRLQGAFESQLANALGQGVGFAGGGAVSGLARGGAYAFPAVSGSAMGGVRQYKEAKRGGASEEQATQNMLVGMGLGSTEAVPIGNLITRLDRTSGGVVKRSIIDAAKEGSEEAVQELIQTLGSNASALATFDEDREITEGLRRATEVGGTSGAILGGVTSLLTRAARRRGRPGDVQAQATERVQETIRRAQESVEDAPSDVSRPRPLQEMDTQDLQSARQEALDRQDQEAVSLIEQEIEARQQQNQEDSNEQTPPTPENRQPTPDRSQPGEPTGDAEPAATPTADGSPTANPQSENPFRQQETPAQIPEADQAEILNRIQRARDRVQRREDAEERLGLGNIPEDPAPEIGARDDTSTDPTETDEQTQQSSQESDAGRPSSDSVEPGTEPAVSETARDEGGGQAASLPEQDQETLASSERAGAEAELDPEMGLRPETRAEEQVGEAIQQAEDQVREAEEQVADMEMKVTDSVSDADSETLQRLAEQTQSGRVRQLLQSELQRRGEQGALFDEDAGQEATEQDLFGGEGAPSAESTSGLERMTQRLEQREAGLKQAREELLRRRQQEAEVRQKARDAQQDLEIEEQSDEQSEQSADRPTQPEQSGTDQAETEQAAGSGDSGRPTDRVNYRAPTRENDGELSIESEARGETVEASVTEEAAQAPEGTPAESLRRLVDEAGKRDKPVQTPESVDSRTAQALYRLAEDGYKVQRSPTARQTRDGVQADEPAFTVEAPKLDDTAPQVETDSGATVGRARRGVTRRTNGQVVYQHSPGDIVVVDESGQYIDRRANGYDEAVAEYFAEHEGELRSGSITTRNESGYTSAVARASDSPQQVLEAHVVQQTRLQNQGRDPVAEMIEGWRYDTSSFDSFTDPGWRNEFGQLVMNWLGGTKQLDAAAQEITNATGVEATPEDIVDYLTENPGGPSRKSGAEQTLEDLADRFERLTGVSLTPDLAEMVADRQREDLTSEAPAEEFEDVEAPFKRLEDNGDAGDYTSLIEVYLRTFASSLGTDVSIVSNPSDLNGNARQAYQRGQSRVGENFSQPAMFFNPPDADPEVYIVADDLAANALAMGRDLQTFSRATLMHEVVAHKGLRELLGGEFESTMDSLFEAIGRGRLLSAETKGGTPLADAYAPELQAGEDGRLTARSRHLLVEEYLANLAEDMSAPESLLQSIWRTVRDAVKRAVGTEITRSELRLLLEASRDHLRAKQDRNSVSSTRFDQRASASVPAARWMMVGTGAIGFDQAQEEGRTFRGFDTEERFEISDAQAMFANGGALKQFVTAGRERNHVKARAEGFRDGMPDELASQLLEANVKEAEALSSLRDGVPLGDVLVHDRLFEQYPNLADEVTVRARKMGPRTNGALVGDAEIALNEEGLRAVIRADRENATTRLQDVFATLLHELQHVVQEREGFSLGSSPTAEQPTAKAQLQQGRTIWRETRSLSAAQTVAAVMQDNDLSADEAVQFLVEEKGMSPDRFDDQVMTLGQQVFDWDPAAITSKISENNEKLRDLGFNPKRPRHKRALGGSEDEAQYWIQRQSIELYRRTAGEIEARLTEERQDVPQDERITEHIDLELEVEYDPGEIITRFQRQREGPRRPADAFHDPDSGSADVPGGRRNMVTVHNLDPHAVRFAVRQMDGHIPVPSLATVRYEDGFAAFGDITLMGSPDLVDPASGTPTFGGDAYTPETPQPSYANPEQIEGQNVQTKNYLESDLHDQVVKWDEILPFDNIDSGLVAYLKDGSADKFYSYLARSPAGQIVFLEQSGQEVDPDSFPTQEYTGFMSDFLKQDALTSFLDSLSTAELNRLPESTREGTPAYDPSLHKRAVEAFKKSAQQKAQSVAENLGDEVDESFAEALKEQHLAEDGDLRLQSLEKMVASYRQMKKTPEVTDKYALQDQLQARIQEITDAGDKYEAQEVVRSHFQDAIDPFEDPSIPRSSKTYNLDNVVEEMKARGIRAAEGSGINFLRALTIERFGSIKEMQQVRDRLTSRDEYEQAAERLETEFERIWNSVRGTHQATDVPGSTPRRRALRQAVVDYVARRTDFEQAKQALAQNGFDSVPTESVKAFMQLVDDLQTEPVHYFESKPQRAVALSEFEAAIVPSDTPAEIREMLQEEVGRVAEYEAGSNADRQQVLEEESARAEVRFQRQEDDTESSEESGDDIPPNPNAITADWSPSNLASLAKKQFRKWFQSRSLLPQSTFEAELERRGGLAAGLERARYSLRDFGAALEEVYDTQNPSRTVIETINEALQNGRRADLDPTQGELFAKPEPEKSPGDKQPDLFDGAPPVEPTIDPGRQRTLNEMTFIEDLPDPVQEAAGRMRDEIDQLSRMSLRSGLYSGELAVVVSENMGTYLTRQYRAHNEEGYSETVKQAVREHVLDEEGNITDLEIDPDDVPGSLGVDPQVWNRAVGHMRETFPGLSDGRVLGELFDFLDTEEGPAFAEGGGKLGSVGQSIYERRKDIPTPLRDLLGQYKDPRENYLNSVVKMVRGVSNQRFLNRVKKAGLGEWLIPQNEGPVVKNGVEYTEKLAADDSRVMSPLNGLYTTPEIKQAFEEFGQNSDRRSALFRHTMKAVGLVKSNLTIGSVKTQVRNYMSAYLFGLSQGHWLDIGEYGAAWRQAHAQTWSRIRENQSDAQREMTQKLLRLGVLDESPRAGEMREMWEDAGLMLEKPMDGHENLAAKYGKAIPRKAQEFYKAGDNVHKIVGFLVEKARYEEAYPDKPESEIDKIAAERIRNGFPTYSLVPEAVKKLRRNPLLSAFPSFYAEIIRNRYNTLRFIKEDLKDPRTRSIGIKRAAGEISKAAMWTGIAKIGMTLAGVGEGEDEQFRRFLPSWEKFSYLFFLPSEGDKQQFVDLGFLNPEANFHEAVYTTLAGEEAGVENSAWAAGYKFAEPFVSKEILSQATLEAVNNQSLETGNPIANPELPLREQVEKRASHVAQYLAPRVLRTASEINSAFSDEDGYGVDGPTKLESIISPLAGQNIRTVDMRNALKWQTINLERRYGQASSIWYNTLTKRGTVSASEMADAYRQSLQAKKDLVESAHQDVNAAESFGLSRGQALSIMKAQGISDKVALGALSGRFMPNPDPNILQGRIESELASGNHRDAALLQQRQKMALQVMREVSSEFVGRFDKEARQAEKDAVSTINE